jgi:hypothetical protein
MPKINTLIQTEATTSSIQNLLDDGNNVYNQILGSLPDVVIPTNPVTTDIATDYVITTDNNTDYVITTDTVPPLTAADYEVFGASWGANVYSSAPSVVPFVWVDNMGGWKGPSTTDSTDDYVTTTNYNKFKTNLAKIPEGKRVLQTTFWSQAPINETWTPLQTIDYYANLDGTTYDGEKLWWTPWNTNIISDARTSVNDFFSRCKADGLKFDYITDNSMYSDGMRPGVWTTSIPPAIQDYIIYVSDSIGNDSWTGQKPVVSGSNGPVKTIQRAATLARNYTGGKNVQIQIRGGTYKMLGTAANPIFYLNANDSGKNGKFITYRPFANEEVIISGSESLSTSAFTKVTSSDAIWSRISTAARGNVYVADVSAYDLGELPEHWRGGSVGGDDRNFGLSGQLPGIPDLTFNGQKMTLSRWPNKTSSTSSGFTFAECAAISSVNDTGTNGIWSVNPEYLSTPEYDASLTSAQSKNGCYGRDTDGLADPSCFRNGVFTYSSDYDSVISKWTTSALTEGIWLSGYWRWDWAFETYKVVGINTTTRQITVRSKNSNYGIQNYTTCDLVAAGTGFENWTTGSFRANPSPRRWVAHNILEELDSAGEYYIDRINKKLYFWPTSAISSSSDIRLTHRAVAGPSAKSTGRFELGYAPNGQPSTTCAATSTSGPCFPYPGWTDLDGVGWSQTGGAIQSRTAYNSKNTLRSLWKFYKVNNIIIEGLTFRDSAGSGLEMQLCEDITVRKCKVYNIRNNGINAAGGKNVTIDSCTVYDIGLCGIINTGGNKQTLTPANKVITKCSIKRCSQNFQALNPTAAVVMNGCGNTLSYNLISEGNTAVLCDGNNHIIEYNNFDNMNQGTDDAGTIYSGRNSSAFGKIVRYNFFNNCGSKLPGGYMYRTDGTGCGGRPPVPPVNLLPSTPPHPVTTAGTIAVYWDDHESGHTVKGNVFYNCGSGLEGGACGFNGGVYNTVENNIIIGSAVGYGAARSATSVWNTHLKSSKWAIYNPNNWPWYETGGPLGSDGTVKPYTGYSPYNAEWVIGYGAGGWDASNWAGLMHAVDIRQPIYVSSYPNLVKLIKQNASGDPELNIDNINDFKNTAKNNVIVQCGQPIGQSYINGGTGEIIGGWTVSGEVVTSTYPDFVNAAGLNFKLTTTGLNAIKAQSPTFEDIPFEKIPTSSYVPEAYGVTCGIAHRHNTCLRDFANPNIIKAIANDARYTGYTNPINGKTLSQDFYSRYLDCMTENNAMDRDTQTVYDSSWYVSTKPTSYDAAVQLNGYLYSDDTALNMPIPPWGNSSMDAATRAWNVTIKDWGTYERIQLFSTPLTNNGYTNVKLSNDDEYPISKNEMSFITDYNLWKEAPADDKGILISPHFYGNFYTGSLAYKSAAYIINPSNDYEKYMITKINPDATPPAGILRFASSSWLAFMTDMRLLRGIIRSSTTAWQRLAPWIIDRNSFDTQGAAGNEAGEYWKELTLHSCLHGALYFNYFVGADQQSANELHAVLNEWRTVSSNSRCEPVTTNRIAVNSNVIISGGRLLKTGKYLWRITAKSSASVTLRAYGSSVSRTDLPQTITLSGSSRGAWLLTTSSQIPEYVLDENVQQTTTELNYISLIGTEQQVYKYKGSALYGGSTHDYGSGVGFDQNGKALGAVNYLNAANIKTSGHVSGRMDWYYDGMYKIDSAGNSIPVTVQVSPTTTLTLCNIACYSSSGCYQSVPMQWIQFAKEMSESGEWGPALRPTRPFPNAAISGTFTYKTINNNVYIAPRSSTSMVTNVHTTILVAGSNTVTVESTAGMAAGDSIALFTDNIGKFNGFPKITAINSATEFTVSANHTTSGMANFSVSRVINGKTTTVHSIPADYAESYVDSSASFWRRTPAQGGRSDLGYDYTSQGTVTLKSGHEYPITNNSSATEVTSTSGLFPVKNEPGGMWNYKGFLFAPVRNDDGCADHLRISAFTTFLQKIKEKEEYKYFILNHTALPSCLSQSQDARNQSSSDFVNGVYRPEFVFVNYEEELVDQIRSLNITGRNGPNNYGKMSGAPLTDKLWQRLVSYVKLTRKMNYYIKQVFGSQAKVNHYDMMSFPYYQEWATNWAPVLGTFWGTDENPNPTTCPFCNELDIGYPGDAVYNTLPTSEKIELNTKANLALQAKVFKLAQAIAKMCLFENSAGQPDVLDLRSELSPLMPQIDPSNFIITGLNHYANSVHGAIVNNCHKYYATTTNGFSTRSQVDYLNNAEANSSRQHSIHHKEQARVGLFANQRAGKLYSFQVQGVCGSDVSPAAYEYYNSNMKTDAGYIKSYVGSCFGTGEVADLPTTSTTSWPAGERRLGGSSKINLNNYNRRSMLRHFPWVNVSNDLLNKYQIATTIKYKDEIIWADNTIASVISTNMNKFAFAPYNFYNQLRPCAQGETANSNCVDCSNIKSSSATLSLGTDVVTVASTTGMKEGATLSKTGGGNGSFGYLATIKSIDSPTQFTASVKHETAGSITFTVGGYIKPIFLEDNLRIRNNKHTTFNCDPNNPAACQSPDCVNYCHYDVKITAGGGSVYNMTSLLGARRHIYGLAVEYASYDDTIAIPYEDIGNDLYWTGYYGRWGRFDPYLGMPGNTTPIPATVSIASNEAQYDNSTWPHIRLSETAKRAQGLGLILGARKDYSIYKYIKNPTQTNVRDWPQPPANFTVDRRPGSAIATSVSGGPDRNPILCWTGNNNTIVNNWKKCLDSSGNPISGKGLQSWIENYLDFNYARGVRRFMIWTPCGTLHHEVNGVLDSGYTSAITSSMQKRVYDQLKIAADGSSTIKNRYVNPSEACWKNITTPTFPMASETGMRDTKYSLLIPSSVAQAESLPLCSDNPSVPCFDPNGRKDEWTTCLGRWITNHPDADVGLYIGYTIPTINGSPASGEISIAGDKGVGGFLQNTTGAGIRGWQVPDPANNIDHETFLITELTPWMTIGIKFLGFDVGQGMFNYENGGTTSYGANKASRTAVGDYKSWLLGNFPELKTVIAEALPWDEKAPILDEFNKVVSSTTYPRKTIMNFDPNKSVCKGTEVTAQSYGGEPFNTVYTDTCWTNPGRERRRKLDPLGKDYRIASGDQNDIVYSSGAYQYCAYLIAAVGWLNSGDWNIGLHNPTTNGFAGVDPNNMWCWYKKNTEIGLYVESMYYFSPTMLAAHRAAFPNNKDASGNFTYPNIWQFTPAWHDAGLATPTPSPTPLDSWDGRNTLRDSDYYNKIRNEIFLKIKNYIERGYIYWSAVGKEDFQLVKDVHQDLLTYIDGFEINEDIYPQDALDAPRSLSTLVDQGNSPYSANFEVSQGVMEFLNTSTINNTDSNTDSIFGPPESLEEEHYYPGEDAGEPVPE